MKITVTPREPEAAKFERDGNVRNYFKQWAVLEVDGLPTSFEVSNDEPLAPGEYELSPKSFGVQNGRLSISRVVLVAVKRSVQQPRSAVTA